MRGEVHADDGMRDVGYHKSPRETPAEAQVEAERQPSINVDGSAVSHTEVVVVAFFAWRNEPVGVYGEV
jgi:hypothetical protein